MGKIAILLLLTGCVAAPKITWPEGPVPEAPALVPLEQVLEPAAE